MGNGAIDYLSFVRGYIAATDDASGADTVVEPDTPHNPHGPDTYGPGTGIDAESYAEGFAAATEPLEHPPTYRELSLQDGGRFTGTLDLADAPPPPAAETAETTGVPGITGPSEDTGHSEDTEAPEDTGPQESTESPEEARTPAAEATGRAEWSETAEHDPVAPTASAEQAEPASTAGTVHAFEDERFEQVEQAGQAGHTDTTPAPDPPPHPAGFRQIDFKQASLRALLRQYDTEALRAERDRLGQGHAHGPTHDDLHQHWTGDGESGRLRPDERDRPDPHGTGPTGESPGDADGAPFPQRPSVSGTLDLD